MASGLSKRVRAIEDAILLIDHLYDRLRYLQPTVASLVYEASGTTSLQRCRYLAECKLSLESGHGFTNSWKDAVKKSPGSLELQEIELISALGDVLGSTDLDSQLQNLAWTREQLEHILSDARAYRDKHHKLYSSLGVLSGIAVAIILI